MSMRYPGGLIATSPVNARYPSGVWTQAQAAPYQAQNVWTRDRFWPNTTLLLQGDGAVNGAQNNTFLDSSSNNFTITRNGNTTQGSFTPYEPEGYWSNYFDGSGDYLLNSSNTIIAATGDFTVECWIYLNNLSAAQYVFSVSSSTTLFEIYVTTGGAIGIQTGSNYRETAAGTLAVGTWYHLAVTRSGSTYTTYLNGSSQTYTASGGTMLSTLGTTPTAIGARSGGTNAVLAGYVSNFRVVTSVVYTGAFTPPAVPLTAITNTSLLTCQSNRFKDNSTNNFTLTVNGNPSVQAFQPFPGATTWSASVLGGSGYFDGSGDYIQAGTNANLALGSGNFTIEGWHYCTGYNGGGTLYSTINTYPSSTGLLFYIDSIGRYTIDVNGTILQPAGTAALNTWVHWAVVRNGSTLSIYINGTSIGSVSSSTNFTDQYAVIGRTGAGTNSNLFLGYLSNTRMVKGTAVYTANFTPPTVPVTAIANTQFLCDFTNAGIYDNSMMNNLETVGNAQVSTSVVKYGTGSMYFDGSGDRLVGRNTPNLNFGSGDWTVEFWIYATDQVIGPIVNQCSQASSAGWGIWAYNGASGVNRKLTVFLNGANFSLVTGSDVWASNTWTHIAVVKSGTNLTVYSNGVNAASSSSAPATITDTTAPPMVGAVVSGTNWGVSYDFTGYIDDLRITKGAARYITNFTPPPARLPAQ